MIAITKRLLLLSPLALLAGRAFARQQAEFETPPVIDEAAFRAVTGKAIDGYILPAYATLQQKTAALAAAVATSCAAPSDTPPPAVRAAFADVLIAWAGVDFFRFGPIAEQGRHERFCFLPDPHGTGARQLRRILAEPDPALLEPGAVAKLSAAVQGLPALESLLFAPSDATETADYRCRLAARIAENLDAIAAATLAGWTGEAGWKTLMLAPGGDNIVYRDVTEPVVEILKAIGVGALQLRDQRLLPALSKSFDAAKPARGVFVKSGLTLPYLRASGVAIGELVTKSDILSLTPKEQAAFAEQTASILAAFAAALDVGNDWNAAFANAASYDKLRSGFDVLKKLEDLYNYTFPVAAQISPGFNALDGD
ncbi:MAG: imelysin family protein [Rhizobiales bacterium]|nr:imelysin family protein [Hyphomicrobiales bacterium]